MNFFKFLQKKPGYILWFLIALGISLAFNIETMASKEDVFFGFLCDIIVPFASGAGIAYNYATWYFNKD